MVTKRHFLFYGFRDKPVIVYTDTEPAVMIPAIDLPAGSEEKGGGFIY